MTDIVSFTNSLRTERMKLIREGLAIYDHAVANKRGVTAEEKAKVDKIDARVAEIEAEVRDLDGRERREREAAVSREAFERQTGYGSAARSSDREEREMRDFLTGEGARVLHVPLGAAIREKAAIRAGADAAELRALAWDTGNSGSLVPTTLSRNLYEYMEASIAMWRAPTTKIITESGNPFLVPALTSTGHAIGTQVIAQGTAIGGTDPAFTRTQFDAYKYGQLTIVASEVIQDSGVEIIPFLAKDLGRGLGRLIDTDLVVGTGTNEPRGLMTALAGNGAGSATTGGSLINPSYENLVDCAYGIADEYRSPKAGWLMRDATAAVIRKLRDGAGGTIGATMWEPSLTAGLADGQPDKLLGFDVYTDPNVASLASNARVLAFADFSAFYIRQVQDLVVERDDSRYFDTDQVAVRAKLRCDGDLMDYAAGFTLVRNV